MLSSSGGDVHLNVSDANILGDKMNRAKLEELPLVDFGKLVTATNNFDEANKLGQGGFGSVYRVMLARLKTFMGFFLDNLLLIQYLFSGKNARRTRNCSEKTIKSIGARTRRIYE